MTRETVFSETLARSATSLMVGLRMPFSAMGNLHAIHAPVSPP
jgi:hypothetical protein